MIMTCILIAYVIIQGALILKDWLGYCQSNMDIYIEWVLLHLDQRYRKHREW